MTWHKDLDRFKAEAENYAKAAQNLVNSEPRCAEVHAAIAQAFATLALAQATYITTL